MRTAGFRIAVLALAAAPLLAAQSAGQWPSPLQVEQRIAAIAAKGAAKDIVVCRTAEGRDVHLLQIGSGDPMEPAVFIAGGVDARAAYSTELALRMAELLVQRTAEPAAGGDDSAPDNDGSQRPPLPRCTYYILPQPSPDAAAHMDDTPAVERATNDRATDDDRDGALDEDGPEDLNGDGVITMMRVADPTGGWRAHPLDSRVLIPVKPELGELGEYALYIEGVDDDGDEQWNEDGPGGVDFNRNFSFDYPYFAPGAGAYQTSEPETAALNDWLWAHPEVAAVITLGGEDNLLSQWGVNGSDPGSEVKTGMQPDDAGYYKLIGDKYKELVKPEGAPVSGDGAGGFLKWAYFDFGRWAFGAQPWWVPEPKKEEKKEEQAAAVNATPASTDPAATAAPVPDPAPSATAAPVPDPTQSATAEPAATAEGAKPKWDEGDKRGKPELDALVYFAANGIDGFVDWTPIEHPDFPGKRVEVGGFKPYLRANPLPAEIDKLAGPQLDFALAIAGMLPRIAIEDAKAEALGGGVYRLSAKVVNLGTLPTVCAMGQVSRMPYPLQLMLGLPAGAELISGHQRERVPPLGGGGGGVERSWIVRGASGATVSFSAVSPTIGSASASVQLP